MTVHKTTSTNIVQEMLYLTGNASCYVFYIGWPTQDEKGMTDEHIFPLTLKFQFLKTDKTKLRFTEVTEMPTGVVNRTDFAPNIVFSR